MRAIWKGSISFGLVNIPVGLYSATRSSGDVKFRMLRKSDLSEIRYKRVAEADGQEVPWEEIVKGYEHQKGEYVVLTDEDFKRVNLASNQTVDIREFVQLGEIDPLYFDQPYFLAPEKGGDKAYILLREALQRTGKVGIAKVVIKTREHLAAVKPHGSVLVLELMHFADELADPGELKLPEKQEVRPKELQMAESLIKTMSGSWDPGKYKDEYREGLLQVIEEKTRQGGRAPATPARRKQATQVVDLVDVLQQSLREHEARKTGKPAGKKRKAA